MIFFVTPFGVDSPTRYPPGHIRGLYTPGCIGSQCTLAVLWHAGDPTRPAPV